MEVALLQINRYWRNNIIIGHNLKDKMTCLKIRTDKVLGIRDICGAKAIVNKVQGINRNWAEITKLEPIYYPINRSNHEKRKSFR